MTSKNSPLSLSKRKLKRLAKLAEVYDVIARLCGVLFIFFAGGFIFVFLNIFQTVSKLTPDTKTIYGPLYNTTITYTPNLIGNYLFINLAIVTIACLFLAPFFAHLADDIENEIEMSESQALLQFNGLKTA